MGHISHCLSFPYWEIDNYRTLLRLSQKHNADVSKHFRVFPAETWLACLTRLQKLSGLKKDTSNVKIIVPLSLARKKKTRQGKRRVIETTNSPVKAACVGCPSPRALAWKALEASTIPQTHCTWLPLLSVPFNTCSFSPECSFIEILFPSLHFFQITESRRSLSTSQTQLGSLSFSFIGIKHGLCIFVWCTWPSPREQEQIWF